jgi:FMN phosphatase YigB (HAD superfamily)
MEKTLAFDVIGAIASGMRSVWLNRNSETIFDPWDLHPTETIHQLEDLIRVLNVKYA